MLRTAPRALAAVLLVAPGCTKGLPVNADGPATDSAMPAPPDLTPVWDLATTASLVATRPYQSFAPSGYDPKKPTALVLALHGLGDTAANLVAGVRLKPLAEQHGFLLAYPDGTPTGFGGGYWNANDVCCPQFGNPPDDVAYLAAVLADMGTRYNVDPKRVYVLGLSNGGMMAHRLACDLSARVAAIVSISGVQYTDPKPCQPTQGVAVMELHGTADMTIPYDGGVTLGGLGPHANSAAQTIAVWVDRNACAQSPDGTAPPVDIDSSLPGTETKIQKWPGCKPGGAAELWTVQGGMHVPKFTAGAPGLLYDWLQAHARP